MDHDRTAYVEMHVQTGTGRRVPVVCWYDPGVDQWRHQICVMPNPIGATTREDAAAAGAAEFARMEAQAQHVFETLMRDVLSGSVRTRQQYMDRMLALVRIAEQISSREGETP